jgi:hypothetical protein
MRGGLVIIQAVPHRFIPGGAANQAGWLGVPKPLHIVLAPEGRQTIEGGRP